MIKDAKFAEKQLKTARNPEAVLRFVPRKDLSGEEIPGQPIPKLDVKEPLVFPKNAPQGITYGMYVPGKVPNTKFEIEQLQREWAVIKTTAYAKEVMLDEWPPLHTPIVVQIQGRMGYTEGFLCEHHFGKVEGTDLPNKEIVFMELCRDSGFEFTADAPVKYGANGVIQQALFIPVDFKNVIAWAYLDSDGQIFHKTRQWNQPIELFADCEFDDTTKTLLSVGLVNKWGRIHYAFDSAAAGRVVLNEWVKDNVVPILLDSPPGAFVTDLNAKKTTFREWLMQVLYIEQNRGDLLTDNVIIHVDFPTDVAYISELLHLGEGARIGQMREVTFKIDYVDAYPTKLKDAVQHNAAWDALAIWFHLGYFSYKVIDELGKQAQAAAAAKESQLPEKQKLPPLVEGLIKGALKHAPKK
uniref:Uncharacterized protein n=1 Tax=Burkholderia phage vB_BgluM-SURPRISE13 TaxID=3159457 RepID=A0AAU7PFJ3_9VIRU